jgi:hypothetical protein
MQHNQSTPWQYKPDGGNASSAGDSDNSEPQTPESRRSKNLSWEAAEFIEHPHGPGWYGSLALATVLLAVIVYLVARDIFATVIIVVVGGIVWVFAGQKPGVAKYEITPSGISVNGKLYEFGNYKSFTSLREGGLSSVNLFPLKRLMPPLSVYFDPKDEPKIIEAIGNYLPYENRQLDQIDRLTRRLRL